MKVKGINWLVTCTPRFNEMAAFCRDVLGLVVKSEGTPVTDTRFTRYVQLICRTEACSRSSTATHPLG